MRCLWIEYPCCLGGVDHDAVDPGDGAQMHQALGKGLSEVALGVKAFGVAGLRDVALGERGD